MKELGLLLDYTGKVLFEHLPEGRSAAYLPDSRSLWEVIWENRKEVYAFAHLHPGSMLEPSHEDLTTFAAIEAGLGKLLWWYIVTTDGRVAAYHWSHFDKAYTQRSWPEWSPSVQTSWLWRMCELHCGDK